MYTFDPFLRYCSATRARFSLKITTLCHSVFSLRSPVALSFHDSEVAILRLTTGSPEFRRRTSGSLPRLPIRMTLFTLPAIGLLHSSAFPVASPPRATNKARTCPTLSCPRSGAIAVCSRFVLGPWQEGFRRHPQPAPCAARRPDPETGSFAVELSVERRRVFLRDHR